MDTKDELKNTLGSIEFLSEGMSSGCFNEQYSLSRVMR